MNAAQNSVFMSNSSLIEIDAAPLYALSPHLTMQFMEPLGATDGSVEAAWDHQNARWRPDVVAATRDLAPGMMRWGGCLSSYYRWREAVGPRQMRVPMHNLLWGGIESGQIGTAEFVDFCAQVQATPLYCVNFESDGRKNWAHPRVGGKRCAGPEEAAAWVSYCNAPNDELRLSHGIAAPLTVKHWQIGNETSYDRNGYDMETAATRTLEFARQMRAVDAEIKLIGWGDDGWAARMIEVAGAELDYLAFHHMFHPSPHDAILDGTNYRRDFGAAWEILMNAHQIHERKIAGVRAQIEGTEKKVALTECHFTLEGRDRGDLMASWAVGVAYARMLNTHERHGDLLEIATLSDFCGTRWQVNSLMIPTPSGKSYLLPVGHVMRLYGKHGGEYAVQVKNRPADLDVTASRTDDTLWLHVVNTRRDRAIETDFLVEGYTVKSGKVFEIAADPEIEITQNAPDVVGVVEKVLPLGGAWSFPAASVSAVELTLARQTGRR